MSMKHHDDGVYCPSPRAQRPAERAWAKRLLEPQSGQSLTEFSLVLPIFLLLVMAIAGFGIVFEKKISLDNAARTGARYAAVHPNSWSASDPAAFASIQGRIQNDGSAITIPNTNNNIKLQYFTSGNTQCGHFDVSAPGDGFVGDGTNPSTNATYTEGQCLIPEALVKVTLTTTYQLPVPIISALFPNGITIRTSATMMLEQACNTSISGTSCS
jgi:Flp pilus assembly protein TadG